MKKFIRGVLVLVIGALMGYALAQVFPPPNNLKDLLSGSLPNFNSAQKDSVAVKTDSISINANIDSLKLTNCPDDDRIREKLLSVSASLEAMKLYYTASKGQDCSGIYHKIKDSIALWMPENCDGNFEFPAFDKARSSRDIAYWYHQKNNLTIVHDPMQERNKIKPGAVMFYSRPGTNTNNLTIENLTGSNGGSGSIMHIATVVDVTKDELGNVIQYTIMHGRNKKYTASRTDFHKEVQSKNHTYLPAFGNWSQPWVAIADIVTKT